MGGRAFLALLCLSVFSLRAPALSISCADRIVTRTAARMAPRATRPLASIQELRVGSYNTLNLSLHRGQNIEGERVEPLQQKTPAQLKALAAAILENDYDILSLQEVDDYQTLKIFSDRYLGGLYTPLLIDGNDPRGIDVGFLLKRDLPLHVEYRTHKEERWNDPILGNKETRVFSRDFPTLILRTEESARPFLIIGGVHLKSKRTRDPSDPESNVKRGGETLRVAEILLGLQREFGAGVGLIVTGDFNGNVNSEAEFAIFKQALALEDAFNLVQPPLTEMQRVTHTWHPTKTPHYSQLDAVILSPSIKSAFRTAGVYRYHDDNGKVKPLPKKESERDKNPSDHYPTLAVFDFQELLRRDDSAHAL